MWMDFTIDMILSYASCDTLVIMSAENQHTIRASLAAHARAAHREYTAKQLGPSLRLEVDPDV